MWEIFPGGEIIKIGKCNLYCIFVVKNIIGILAVQGGVDNIFLGKS